MPTTPRRSSPVADRDHPEPWSPFWRVVLIYVAFIAMLVGIVLDAIEL